jgi:hypothetical protein
VIGKPPEGFLRFPVFLNHLLLAHDTAPLSVLNESFRGHPAVSLLEQPDQSVQLSGLGAPGEVTEKLTLQAAGKSSSRIAGLHYYPMGGAAIPLPLAAFGDGGA